MAKRAPMTLGPMKATKPAAVVPIEAATPERGHDSRKGQTLRLTMDAWKQLKHMSVDEGKTAHELLLEGVNMLFRDRGRPPIA